MNEITPDPNRAVYKRLLIRSVIMILVAAFIVFALPRLVNMLLPFVIALIGAMILNPLITKINQRLGISRGLVALVFDLLVFIVIFLVLGVLVYSIVNEAISLAIHIQHNWGNIVDGFTEFERTFAWLYDFLPPQVTEIIAGWEASLAAFVQNLSRNIVNGAISFTTTTTTKVSNFFLVFIITMLAAFFIMADYPRLKAWFHSLLGERNMDYFLMLKNSIFTAVINFSKSLLLLALFAFVVMFVALTIYGQPYALLIAIFLGLVDLFPVIGTIAILIPWGIIEWVAGDMKKGIFLIILGIGFFLARKMVEPKVVGSQTGMHPLLALMSAYVGLQFSGVWGAILGPVFVMVAISVVRSGVFDSTMADLGIVAANIRRTLRG